MALLDLISENVVKVPLVSTTKPEVIRELIELLKKASKISDADKIYDAVMKRESLGSTGLENGIAVPHAKTIDVPNLVLGIGIAPAGVDFQSFDGKPSKLFFILLAPPDKAGPHIEALSEIAKITKSQAFCRMLIKAESAQEVVDIFREE
jgi:mannitol/fructose-specific phosphotransferase system IIA component (Ntr-type)